MKKFIPILLVSLIVAISCQNEDKQSIANDQEINLKDSLDQAAKIEPVDINFPQFKSADSNLALGATAYAQSTYSGYSPAKVNDGSTNVSVGGAYSWANAHKYGTDGRIPQWFDLRFDSTISFSNIRLFTTYNYELKKFKILINTVSGWDTISTVLNNTQTLVNFNYDTTYQATTIRVLCERGPDNQYVYTRINELEVYE